MNVLEAAGFHSSISLSLAISTPPFLPLSTSPSHRHLYPSISPPSLPLHLILSLCLSISLPSPPLHLTISPHLHLTISPTFDLTTISLPLRLTTTSTSPSHTLHPSISTLHLTTALFLCCVTSISPPRHISTSPYLHSSILPLPSCHISSRFSWN